MLSTAIAYETSVYRHNYHEPGFNHKKGNKESKEHWNVFIGTHVTPPLTSHTVQQYTLARKLLQTKKLYKVRQVTFRTDVFWVPKMTNIISINHNANRIKKIMKIVQYRNSCELEVATSVQPGEDGKLIIECAWPCVNCTCLFLGV